MAAWIVASRKISRNQGSRPRSHPKAFEPLPNGHRLHEGMPEIDRRACPQRYRSKSCQRDEHACSCTPPFACAPSMATEASALTRRQPGWIDQGWCTLAAVDAHRFRRRSPRERGTRSPAGWNTTKPTN